MTKGLSCASRSANLYLTAFDKFMSESLGAALYFSGRFLDDATYFHNISFSGPEVLAIANGWHADIHCTLEGHGKHVSVLDLEISLLDAEISWRTFRKNSSWDCIHHSILSDLDTLAKH